MRQLPFVPRALRWTAAAVVALVLWPSVGLAVSPPPPPPLRELAEDTHLQIGSTVQSSAVANEADYASVLAEQFSSVTPETELWWQNVEPTQGSVDYSAAGAIVAFARAHHQSIRGSDALVWNNSVPSWLSTGVANGSISNAQLSDILHQHVTQTLTHFAGQIDAWDVVTDPLNEDGSLRQNIWLTALGPGYIAQAFRWAHAADPRARLYISDFTIDTANPKSDAMLALVNSLRANGVPIDGVAFEEDLSLQFAFSLNMQANFARFAAIPLDVAITSANVRMFLPSTPALLAAQASYFDQLIEACLGLGRRCVSFTLWEYTDRHSPVPQFFTGQGAATPFDANLQPKPAYFALSNALNKQTPLRKLTRGDHLQIGSAVQSSALANEADYASVLAQQFSSVTPETDLRWETIEPSQGNVDYSAADAIVAFATVHHQSIRGSDALVWNNRVPSWLSTGVANGSISNAQLSDILHQHVTQTVNHFAGRIRAWDVVNEPLNEDGTLRQNIWLNALGPGYIAEVLNWAHAADPDARLYISDFTIDTPGPESDAMLALVNSLRVSGVPLDGVGFEEHLDVRFAFPPNLQSNLARFAALPLDVAITEADVRMILPTTPALLDAQASYFDQLMEACLNVHRCVSFMLWEYTDRHSWVPQFFTGEGAATPFDANLQPKPAYFALSDALRIHRDPS